MLFKRYKNGYNAIIYVNDDDPDNLIVLDKDGNDAASYNRDMLLACGYENNTEDAVRFIHSGFSNKTIKIPEQVTCINLIGDVTVYGYVYVAGKSIVISGNSLTIINPNPFAPLIGRDLSNKRQTRLESIVLNLNELNWETANDLFLFGEYGREPMDNVKILENVKTVSRYSVYAEMHMIDGYPVYTISHDEKVYNFLKSKYMETSIYEFTKVVNRIIDDKSHVEAKNIAVLFENDYITCNMTVSAFETIRDLQMCTKDYAHLIHSFEYFASTLNIDFPIQDVRNFYMISDALNVLDKLLKSINTVEDVNNRYKLYMYVLMMLHLPIVDIDRITCGNLLEALDKQYEERSQR